jgi:hypothetical protein
MPEAEYAISVGLWLRGDSLDPSVASEVLGKKPDHGQFKGQVQHGKEGRKYVRKIGIWSLKAKPEPCSDRLADYIEAFLAKIDFDTGKICTIKGLEEAYIDVFIAGGCGKTHEFEIDAMQMSRLARIGVPVRLTLSFF